jgi:hypothetical protein
MVLLNDRDGSAAMSTNRNVPLRGIADSTKRESAPPAVRRMVPSLKPRRHHGDPQSFRLRNAKAKGSWCGRGDLNPHEPLGSTDFLADYGFRRPDA